MKIKRAPDAKQPLRTTQMGYKEFGDEVPDTRVVTGGQEIWRGSSIKDQNLSPEELVVLLDGDAVVVLRRSWRAQIVRWVLLVAAVLLAIWFTVQVPNSIIGFLPMFGFFPLAVMASLIHARFDSKYVIADKQLTAAKGLCSFNYLAIRVDYTQLKGVEIAKNLIQRLVNCGDVRLSTAMFDQPEVVFRDLVNPQYYTTVIRLKQRDAQAQTDRPSAEPEEASVVEESKDTVPTERSYALR